MLRSLSVQIFEIMLLAVALHVMRAGCLHRSFWRLARMDAHPTTLSVAPLIYLLVFPLAVPVLYAIPGVVFAILLLTLVTALDLSARRYFDQGAVDVFSHLPVTLKSLLRRNTGVAYLKQYVPLYYYLPAPVASALAWIMLRSLARPSALIALMAACLFEGAVIIGAVVISHRNRNAAPAELSDIEKAILDLGEAPPKELLYKSPRMQNIRSQGAPLYKPATILLIINESAGRHLPASSGAGYLADKIRALSGDAGSWFLPTNAVTNSSCTDVSLPSILTGCGSHEGIETLHALPFVFDLAKFHGYTTQFYTSSSMDWANFDQFIQSAALDTLFSAETTGLKYINDTTVDDMVPVRAWIENIRHCDVDVFSVIYNNSLHLPYQAESVLNIPSSLKRRRDRALFILESAHGEIFDALKATGRYDDALIFIIGDHGEFEQLDENSKELSPRLINLPKEVLHPLFMIKPPKALPRHLAKALTGNKNALIANVDIAPTLADLFQLQCEGRDYTGQSLFSKIPADRFSFILTTNAWRSWPRNAAAIIRGHTQLVADHMDNQLYRINGTKADRNELLAQALRHPALGVAIGKTFEEKLKNRAEPADIAL